MAFANLGKDQSDCLQESERVEVLYDRMAAPGENPLNPLKTSERIFSFYQNSPFQRCLTFSLTWQNSCRQRRRKIQEGRHRKPALWSSGTASRRCRLDWLELKVNISGIMTVTIYSHFFFNKVNHSGPRV